MKKFKKLGTVLVLSLTLAMSAPAALPGISQMTTVEAATVKLNKKTASLTVGQTLQLKITGTKAKAAWTSSSKTAATVDKNGKVTAKKAGKTTITATVNKKKYTCVVTVKAKAPAPLKPSIETPFEAVVKTFEGYHITIPKAWATLENKDYKILGMYLATDDPKTAKNASNMVVNKAMKKLDYDTLNTFYLEALKSSLGKQGIVLSDSDIKVTEAECKIGTGMKIEYSITIDGVVYPCTVYVISTDNSLIEISASDDSASEVTPNGSTVAEYVYKSIEIAK